MGASFRNIRQIIELAGCDLLTISPELLSNLQDSSIAVVRQLNADDGKDLLSNKLDITEAAFRLQLNNDAMATEKLAEGIRSFCTDIEKLEQLLK